MHVTKLPPIHYFRFRKLKTRKSLEPSGFFRFLLTQKAEVAVHMVGDDVSLLRVLFTSFYP